MRRPVTGLPDNSHGKYDCSAVTIRGQRGRKLNTLDVRNSRYPEEPFVIGGHERRWFEAPCSSALAMRERDFHASLLGAGSRNSGA